ncbi:hypothetical protein AWN56_08980, partial [Enterococcus faecium]
MQTFEHRFPRGCEKAAMHHVLRAAKLNQLLMFLTLLDLLPQMQAFEHRLFGKRAWDKSKEHFCLTL